MIDRLKAKGLVVRERRAEDCPCVHCRVTGPGPDLLTRLDRLVVEANQAAFGLTESEVTELTTLLEKIGTAR